MRGNFLITAGSLAMTVCLTSHSVGQGNFLEQRIESFEFKNVKSRQVLKSLFKSVNASYWIIPEIDGEVTISKKNATFELVLQNVLAQINATYHYEGGVFCIVKHDLSFLEPPKPLPPVRKDGKAQKIYINPPDRGLIRLLNPGSQDDAKSVEIRSLIHLSMRFVGGRFTPFSPRLMGGGFSSAPSP
jgi:type II secretory pathway component GspD/PulD (secretin)